MAENVTNLRRTAQTPTAPGKPAGYRLEAGVVWVTGSAPAPDHGGRASWSVVAWSFSGGVIAGVDVSGLRVLDVSHSPGGTRPPQRALFLDERATPDQVQALVDCFGGRLAGPLGGSVPVEFGFYQLPIVEDEGSLTVTGRLRLHVPPERRDPGAEVSPVVSGVRLPAVTGWSPTLVDVQVNVAELGLVWRQRGCRAALGDVVLVA